MGRVGMLAVIAIATQVVHGQDSPFAWEDLPELPVAISGHFAGVHEGTLIVGGGASFPVSPFDGGTKQWHDATYYLPAGADAWVEGPLLPHAAAYGAAIQLPGGGLVCLGGSDGTRHYDDWYELWSGADGISVKPNWEAEGYAPLPQPCAMNGGAYLDGKLYVAGGQTGPDATGALLTFWRFDLLGAERGWEELEAWPGPGRILPVVVSHGGAVYVVSGAELFAREDGTAGRRYLTDAYRFDPAEGWTQIADVPRAVVAAPAASIGQSHFAVFGGDDGVNADRVQALGNDHPGFSSDVLVYHTITDTWATRGETPAAYVTTAAIVDVDRVIVAGGEDRPGHRGDRVIAATIRPSSGGFGAINFAVVAIYFALLIAMGFYFSRREQTTQDYFLGGKRVPWWAMGISIFGTQLSAITFLSIPARSYATDWVYVWANAGIVFIAPYVVYCVLPKYRAGNYTTAYEYLEVRFNVLVRVYGALVFLLFQAGRMGIVLFLPSIALHAATGIDIYVCIAVMGILSTLYTVLGGIEAVIWTDVAQVVVLSSGVVFALSIIVGHIDGGLAEVMSVAGEADKFHMNNWTWDMTTTALWLCVIGNIFAVAYPYTADQTLVQRYLASASQGDAERAIWTNAILAIPATLVFFLVGTALWVYYKAHPEMIDPTLQNDAVFPMFIVQELPVGISGLVVAAIFAAAMSSLDSSLNSIATVCVHDFYKRIRSPFSDAHGLRVARILTCVFGVLATGAAISIARLDVQSIFDQYLRILGLTGGGLAGLLALGIFSKRANGAGALTGALVSALVVYYVSTETALHAFSFGMIGFVSSLAVGYLASLVTGGRVAAGEV